jgi:hypothetical protein
MKDFQLYQQILGLVEPWAVEGVTLKPRGQEVEVRVGFAATLWGCPQCQERMEIHGDEERCWRHLDSCQFKTIIVSRVPVVRCEEHGWGRRKSRNEGRLNRCQSIPRECFWVFNSRPAEWKHQDERSGRGKRSVAFCGLLLVKSFEMAGMV